MSRLCGQFARRRGGGNYSLPTQQLFTLQFSAIISAPNLFSNSVQGNCHKRISQQVEHLVECDGRRWIKTIRHICVNTERCQERADGEKLWDKIIAHPWLSDKMIQTKSNFWTVEHHVEWWTGWAGSHNQTVYVQKERHQGRTKIAGDNFKTEWRTKQAALKKLQFFLNKLHTMLESVGQDKISNK